MAFLLALFLLSLSALLGMLGFRIWQLRTGKAEYVDRAGEHGLPLRAYVRRDTVTAIRRKGHVAIISVIKFWVIANHVTAKQFRKRFPKAHGFLKEKARLSSSHPLAAVRRHAAEYKRKMKKFRDKLREHDETGGEL